MSASKSDLASQQIRDWLFARLGGESNPESTLDEVVSADEEPGQGLPDALSHPVHSAPPDIRGPEDLRVASEWLQKERERLEAYTRTQLANLQQQHQALVSQNYKNEHTLILRSQELARREELVLAQGRALHQRGEELSKREQALAGQLAQWRDAQRELAQIQQVAEQVRRETESHRSLLAALEAEAESLRQSKEAARAELDGLVTAIEQHREARAREEATLKARQTQLEQRLGEADRATRAYQQRLAELDDLEANLRGEFEEQEQRTTRERQDLDALREAARWETSLLAARQAELDRRQLAIEEAELAEQQRQQELDVFQESLEDYVASLARQQGEPERRAEGRTGEWAEDGRELASCTAAPTPTPPLRRPAARGPAGPGGSRRR